jgi:rfaE bifunctional protein nucleotidyltransferase chain/domain/rfaE bifunctional protein kinase chain/domain
MTCPPAARTPHVVVVGDVLLDVDVETATSRLVPDSAAPVLDEVGRRVRAGGAGLAARFVADDGCRVTLVTAVPEDEAGATVLASLGDVRAVLLPCDGATSVKTRLRRGAQTVARLDQGGDALTVTGVPDAVAAALAEADAVLVSDYGRGVTVHPQLLEALAESARRRPLVWDPHPRGPEPVRGARIVTPNAAEAARACGGAPSDTVAEACRQARALVERWRVAGVALTIGARGAVLAAGGDSAAVFPPPRRASGDACGAGDRFAARVAAALAAGALSSEAVADAVAAAADFLTAGGVASLDALSTADAAGSAGDAAEVIQAVRARGGTVVATGGCFDLLHAGHVGTLEKARALGDCLIVCVNSDDSVRRSKGPDRPVQSVADRLRVLEALAAVDAVVVFHEDTPERMLAELRPDVWVKGGDYAGAELPETALVRSWGGEVVTVPYLPGRSTTRLLARAKR